VSKKNSYLNKLQFTEGEKFMVLLEKIASSTSPKAGICRSLISWFMEHRSWTPKQLKYVRALVVQKHRKEKQGVEYFLYAISDGNNVKIGFSSNIPKRVKSLQTANSGTIKVLWRLLAGNTSTEASKQEKKLHRFCRKYKIRGEWYKKECMFLVEQFGIKERITRKKEQESAEMEIVYEAVQHI